MENSPPPTGLCFCGCGSGTKPGAHFLPGHERAAAGHDRMIVRIRPEDLDAWLNPDPGNLQALYDMFDRRPRPYYEHELSQ